MSDHYFTDAQPVRPGDMHSLVVSLAGQDVSLASAGGVFSGGRLDKGTAVLLDEVPEPPARGTFVDVGCGWGPIALSLALRSREAEVWAVDVNERALDLTRRNAATLGLDRVHAMRPEDVPPGPVDLIWSNPPIRVGKAVVHEVLRTWLPRLAPDGEAYLVVSKNLGADSLQRWIGEELGLTAERVASRKGFRVLKVTRA